MSRSDDGTADADTTADKTAGETSVDLSRPHERVVYERARFLETTTNLREPDAVAWSELRYSSSGTAKQIDSGASMVSTYLERAVAAYEPEAAHTRATSTLADDAEPPDRWYQWVGCESGLEVSL